MVFLVIAPIFYLSFKYIVIYWIYHIIYILTGGTTTLGGSTTGFVTTDWVVVTTDDFIGDVGYDTCCIIT